jgi:hypothetical protein
MIFNRVETKVMLLLMQPLIYTKSRDTIKKNSIIKNLKLKVYLMYGENF